MAQSLRDVPDCSLADLIVSLYDGLAKYASREALSTYGLGSARLANACDELNRRYPRYRSGQSPTFNRAQTIADRQNYSRQ